MTFFKMLERYILLKIRNMPARKESLWLSNQPKSFLEVPHVLILSKRFLRMSKLVL